LNAAVAPFYRCSRYNGSTAAHCDIGERHIGAISERRQNIQPQNALAGPVEHLQGIVPRGFLQALELDYISAADLKPAGHGQA
jgi:hypothetical protein